MEGNIGKGHEPQRIMDITSVFLLMFSPAFQLPSRTEMHLPSHTEILLIFQRSAQMLLLPWSFVQWEIFIEDLPWAESCAKTIMRPKYRVTRRLRGNLSAYWKVWKGYILYDSDHMTFWKRQNCGNSKNISGFWGLRKGRKGRLGGFLGQWNYSL